MGTAQNLHRDDPDTVSNFLIHRVQEMASAVRLATAVHSGSGCGHEEMAANGGARRPRADFRRAHRMLPASAVPGSSASANSGQLPFDRVSESGGISPTAGFTFDGIPAGTEFTVRLQMALSSTDSRAGDSFQAVLDEPLVIAKRTVAPQGTPVTGSVLAARASEV